MSASGSFAIAVQGLDCTLEAVRAEIQDLKAQVGLTDDTPRVAGANADPPPSANETLTLDELVDEIQDLKKRVTELERKIIAAMM